MKIAIMQPYFLPYIGYFQLISAVDVFVIYDNIKYTKKGWINRNRILVNGQDEIISLPLKKDSDFLNVVDRSLSDDFDRKKLINKIRGAYQKAPFFKEVYPLLEGIISYEDNNLFEYINNAVVGISNYLDIKTTIVKSSDIDIDHKLKAQDKVIRLCCEMGASEYINAKGGIGLYSKEELKKNGINIRFINSNELVYKQFGNEFVPWLSIADVLMFNELEKIKDVVKKGYELI